MLPFLYMQIEKKISQSHKPINNVVIEQKSNMNHFNYH